MGFVASQGGPCSLRQLTNELLWLRPAHCSGPTGPVLSLPSCSGQLPQARTKVYCYFYEDLPGLCPGTTWDRDRHTQK